MAVDEDIEAFRARARTWLAGNMPHASDAEPGGVVVLEDQRAGVGVRLPALGFSKNIYLTFPKSPLLAKDAGNGAPVFFSMQ